MARLLKPETVMIWELLLALSLPIWLLVEQIATLWRTRRRAHQRLTIVAARKRSRQAAIDSLLSRTSPSARA